MFQKLFSLLMLFCIGANFTHAQSYYKVGEVYSFKGTNADETKEVTISVVFDEKGIATISRQEAASETAKGALHYLAAKGTLKFENSTLSVVNPKAKLWIVSFEPTTPSMPMRIGGQAAVHIDCPCRGNGTCEVSVQQTGNGGCFTCVSIDCARCRKPLITEVPLVGGSYLVLQATGITFGED